MRQKNKKLFDITTNLGDGTMAYAEPDSGYCDTCGKPGATEFVGNDSEGNALYAHTGHCARESVQRALGRPMAEVFRHIEERAG